MHINRISLARKITLGAGLLAGLILFSGCGYITLSNLTPASMPENPSHIYTFSLRFAHRSHTIPKSSVVAQVIIDGQNHVMKPSPLGEGMYDFEYHLPPGRDEIAYYFLVNYGVEGNGVLSPREAYTEVSRVKIARRYVLSLESNRGPVGARISVVGRGFTPQDSIALSGSPARTVFESPNAISFFVPPLEPNRNYQVTLNSATGGSSVGTFRIDPSDVTVHPSSLFLQTGVEQALSFTLANAAPPGGTLLDIATDIPDSVIMPEVIVPQGQTGVTVTVRGGTPGKGSLFLRGFGSGEIAVPVTVVPR